MPSLVEVGDADDLGGPPPSRSHGVGEPAAPQPVEDAELFEPGLIVTRSVGIPA